MFRHCHQVRYHETDAQQFLFNSRYLEIADVAMAEFFRYLGWPYPALLDRGLDPSVVSASLTFHRPARFDDFITFEVRCPRLGRTSFDLHHRVLRDGEELGTLQLTYVNVDPRLARSRPLPPDIAAALTSERNLHAVNAPHP